MPLNPRRVQRSREEMERTGSRRRKPTGTGTGPFRRPEIMTEELVELYGQGNSLERIARLKSCSTTLVRDRLLKANVKLATTCCGLGGMFSPEQVHSYRERWKKGESIGSLAREAGCWHMTMSRMLRGLSYRNFE